MRNTYIYLLILFFPISILAQENLENTAEDSLYYRPLDGETNAFLTNGDHYFQLNYLIDKNGDRWDDYIRYGFNFGLNDRSMLSVSLYSSDGFVDFHDIYINYDRILVRRSKIAIAASINSSIDTGVESAALFPAIKMTYGIPRSNLTLDFRPSFLLYFTIPDFEFNTFGNFFSNSNFIVSGIYGFKNTGVSIFTKNYIPVENIDIWWNKIGIIYDKVNMRWAFNLENQKSTFSGWMTVFNFSVAWKL